MVKDLVQDDQYIMLAIYKNCQACVRRDIDLIIKLPAQRRINIIGEYFYKKLALYVHPETANILTNMMLGRPLQDQINYVNDDEIIFGDCNYALAFMRNAQQQQGNNHMACWLFPLGIN